jgi:hypothetical protein
VIATMRVGDDRVKKVTAQQMHQKFDLTTFDDGEIIKDYALCLSSMTTHLTTLSEEVKDGEIVVKMIRPLPPHVKQITIVIKTLLDVSTMSTVDLTGQLKEAFEEAPTSLQQDGKLYLTEEEWDTRRKKREAENHSDSGARGGGTGKGRGRGQDCSRGGSSSSGSSRKPTGDECRCYGKMVHWARECCSKSKKEQAHVTQDEDEASLMLVSATLIHSEVISSSAEVEFHKEKVFAHLDKEKERDVGTWVLDTRVTNHISRCRVAFMKIDTAVLSTMCSSDDSVARIEGCGTQRSCARTASPGPSTGSTSSLV